MTEPLIQVMIVDDEILIREGLRRILENFRGVRVVAVCAGEEAVVEAERRQPDLVLLDIKMPHRDGLSVLSDLRGMKRPPVVAMLTAFDAEEHLSVALRGGAAGFLLKDTAPRQLEYAINQLAEGNSVISPRLTRTIIHGYVHGQSTPTVSLDSGNPKTTRRGAEELRPSTDGVSNVEGTNTANLTSREGEVLQLLTRGLSNREIGKELCIGATTVKDHVSVLFGKLGVTNRVQAAVQAVQRGIVDGATAGRRRTA